MRLWMLFVALAAGWVAGVLLPPFVGAEGRVWVMALFHPLCHQDPQRSFWFAGAPLAVCHRCTGIYGGALLGVLLGPLLGAGAAVRAYLRRKPFHAVLLAGLPMALDWGLDVGGLWMNTVPSRVLTGALFGGMTGCVLALAVWPTVRNERAAPP